MPRHFKPHFQPDADSVTSVERSEGSGPGWKRPMPRVSSMLFELELEDQELGEEASPPLASRQLLQLLQPATPLEQQLGRAVHVAYESAATRRAQLSIDELTDQLRSQGYDVRIRTALGGGDNRECLRNLRHQFLTLNMAGPDGSMAECIIDPSFAEQWGIARPTPAYSRIVAALPQVYVGSSVEPLVFFLCGELAAAFKAEGAMLPPWRSADAMLSKWRPRRSVDCDMLLPPSAPSPSAFQAGASARRSMTLSRPAKAQRLNGNVSRPQRSPRSGSFGSGSGSPINSGSIAGSFNPAVGAMRQAFALTKSASNALSDAEAAEALADVDVPSDGDASDSSNDSDFSFHGRTPSVAALSSSWRASDCMPFQTLPTAAEAAAFGAVGQHVSGQPFGCRRASRDERVSGSDGSDTTAGPPPLHGSASHSHVQAAASRLMSAPPRLLQHDNVAFAASAPNPRSPAAAAAAAAAHFDPFAAFAASKPPLHVRNSSGGAACNGGSGSGLQNGPAASSRLPKSGLRFPSKADGALARKSGGRTVKLVPLFQAGGEALHASNSSQL